MSSTYSVPVTWSAPVVTGLVLGAAVACAPVVQTQGVAPAVAPPAANGALLDSQRIATLPAAERDAWMQYLAASRQQREIDRKSMNEELQRLGRDRWTPAPEGPAFTTRDEMTDEWFRSAEGRRLTESVLSFQTPSGGWSKRIDFQKGPRQPGQSYSVSDGWSYIATFDNNATTEQLEFLAAAYRATRDPRYQQALARGLEYVFRAQFPNGCWPQVYPLQGSYHDAVTFNDDATVRILQILRDLRKNPGDVLPEAVRSRAEASFLRGVDCILASQVVVNGRKTAWGAQHDPLTLQPVKARAYEHASLSGGESVDLMELLMGLSSPDPRVEEAVHGAAAWFRETAIHGFDYEPKGGLVARPGAGPLWARFYEIGTNRPIFSNRDGVILYSWDQLENERKYGYSWFRPDAARALQKYENWARRHPRTR